MFHRFPTNMVTRKPCLRQPITRQHAGRSNRTFTLPNYTQLPHNPQNNLAVALVSVIETAGRFAYDNHLKKTIIIK